MTILVIIAYIIVGFVAAVGAFGMRHAPKGEKVMGAALALSYLIMLGEYIYG